MHELDTNEYQYEMNKFLVQSILESILEDFHVSDPLLDAYFQHESLYYGTADVYPRLLHSQRSTRCLIRHLLIEVREESSSTS